MNVWLRTNTMQHIDIQFLSKTLFSNLIVNVTVIHRLKTNVIFFLVYITSEHFYKFPLTTSELCSCRVDTELSAATAIVRELRNSTKSNKKHTFLSVRLQRISFQLKRNKCLLIQSSYLLWNVYRNIPRKCKRLFSTTYKGKPVAKNCKNKPWMNIPFCFTTRMYTFPLNGRLLYRLQEICRSNPCSFTWYLTVRPVENW
jgi:hypothetical protein